MRDDMLIVAMNRLLIIHNVLHDHVTMKVIVISSYNTEKKRVPRGGRARTFYYSGTYQTGHGTKSGGRVLQKRDADVEEDNAEVTFL